MTAKDEKKGPVQERSKKAKRTPARDDDKPENNEPLNLDQQDRHGNLRQNLTYQGHKRRSS